MKLSCILGKQNVWSTVGNNSFLFDKIKQHKEKSDVHHQAEDHELNISSRVQPMWNETRSKQITKQQQAVQNIIFASIYTCQQYQSLNSLSGLCVLLEKLDVQLLPSEISGVNYRNKDAALMFLHHVAFCLHEELVGEVKSSPVVGR